MNFPMLTSPTGLLRRGPASLASCLLFAVFAALVAGCGTDRPASEPSTTGTQAESTRLLGLILPTVDREQAISIAETAFAESDTTVTAVDDPQNMVARLIQLTGNEFRHAESLPFYGTHRNKLVWVVQAEGESRPLASAQESGGEPVIYRFNAVVIDSTNGHALTRLQSEYEPFILPLEFLPEELVEVETAEHSVARSALAVSRDEAVRIVIEEYGGRRQNLDAIETVLVRYSNPSSGTGGTFGPDPTSTAVIAADPTPTATSPTDPTREPTATRAPRPTPTPIVDRISWLVIVPSELSFSGCFISGPAGTRHFTCWMGISYFVVDAETGAVDSFSTISGNGSLGPRVSNEESLALQHYAWAEGWWSLWHEVRQYNGDPIPAGLAAELDRPDAPTPTPRPPTPTPDPGLPPTPTPTPPPTATAT